MFEDYKTKEHVTVIYTGEGKGKTSASLGLMVRALGRGWKVAYVQFVKTWETGESKFIDTLIATEAFQNLSYFRGGKGFYNAGALSAAEITEKQHKQAAEETFKHALKAVESGDYDVVICDEINNSVHDGLLTKAQLKSLINAAQGKTSLCLTGRDFPQEFIEFTDIATNMTKLKHHFDDKYLANKGIDY